MDSSSELRRDLISGDWVVIATGRGKRPQRAVKKRARDLEYEKTEGCPFDNPQSGSNAPPLFVVQKPGAQMSEDWFIQVIPNKYPALAPGEEYDRTVGPFDVKSGVGFHELVITQPHDRGLPQFSIEEASLVLHTYRSRYHALAHEHSVRYISIFHNFGKEAGASIFHPHSQILAIPVIPPDVNRSFQGSLKYFEEKGHCVHCDLIGWERQQRLRVIFENNSFIALCPFVSRSAFEVRIFPKAHEPCFQELGDRELSDAAEALKETLRKIWAVLEEPSYNFFIHSSPCGKSLYFPHYHWHLEVLPKVSIWAGFEIATGIEISTVAPEEAAAMLRKA
ncbi:MAG: hypothetical protein A2806_04635 [Candidatus Terrybacteria bacterium RIFCSPHIGHO2_01_FULL_48_17]|uniref:Uncharacterized protein n=1 Tax=Candidatus Terrybacteria bacterium RIFCSPHIGHO2_01_FULL_48_17 TaxID=1802362 RepID=A0A1G2PMW5_9BACT|nr:MAG: hypothetical protein A2806_04635 [Candidatus Terrybacteria bacterium RIFCSPHIGHO2_01_FULL_48_17]OHA52112.1 MAG: hypothetical protein A3A30_04350 [Candidatus Terrybacteria bacterium RIFCSPLOWO2_01_FULL_48_14]